jgi:beta-glucosidase
MMLLCSVAILLSFGAAKAQAEGMTTAQAETVEKLLQEMTLAEKVGQLSQYSYGAATGPGGRDENLSELIAAGRVGSLLNVVKATQLDGFQKIAVERSRLHIPVLFALDVIHGFRTTFPIPLGLSASWDPELVAKTARLAAQETSAQGIRWTFSPMVDIARDARWGRIAESAGEDPFLGSALAAAAVHGYQGQSLGEASSILACAKHFVGYGAAEGGRDYNTTEIGEPTLRQVYLPPFKAAVDAGVATLMSAFNALNGMPATANAFILDQILRKEWGFPGVVVSDWRAIEETMVHGIADSGAAAAQKAFMAGVDMDMEDGLFDRDLPELVKAGAVPMKRIDEAVRRVLRLKAALGLFERPYAPESVAEGPLAETSRTLARQAAEASFVLLQNRPVQGRALLPLAAKPGLKIALIGPLADSAVDMLGSWSAQGRAEDVVTLNTALTKRAREDGMVLLHARGTGANETRDVSELKQARRVAAQSDVVILTLGEKGERTGEAASRAHLDLAPTQQELMEEVVASGKPVILVLFSGRPLTITWAAEHVPAILAAWFPGIEAGPALVRTLFGEHSPSGHLTATWPRAVGQEPSYYNTLNTGRPMPANQRMLPPHEGERYISRYIDEVNTPLWSFGHGLSYTTFDYSPVQVGANVVSAEALNRRAASLHVSATVTNTGPKPGTTVAQCYIRLTGTSLARPVRELKGFQRLELGPGESKRIEFTLTKSELAFWNQERQFHVEPAKLSLWIAPDSSSGTPVPVTIVP